MIFNLFMIANISVQIEFLRFGISNVFNISCKLRGNTSKTEALSHHTKKFAWNRFAIIDHKRSGQDKIPELKTYAKRSVKNLYSKYQR